MGYIAASMEVWFDDLRFQIAPGLRRSGPVVFRSATESIEVSVLGSTHAGLLESERRSLRRATAGLGPTPRMVAQFDLVFAQLDAQAFVARTALAGIDNTHVVAIAPTAWGVSMCLRYRSAGSWRDVVPFVRAVGGFATFPPNPAPDVPRARVWMTGLLTTVLPDDFAPEPQAAFEDPVTGLRLEVAIEPTTTPLDATHRPAISHLFGWADEVDVLASSRRPCPSGALETWWELRVVRQQVVHGPDGPILTAEPEQRLDVRELRWQVPSGQVRATAAAPDTAKDSMDAAWNVLHGSLAARSRVEGPSTWQPFPNHSEAALPALRPRVASRDAGRWHHEEA